MFSVRLPKDLEQVLDIISEQKRVTKSEIVKEAIAEYIKANIKSPYETGKDLFGCDDSNISNGSVEYRSNVRRRIREKHTH